MLKIKQSKEEFCLRCNGSLGVQKAIIAFSSIRNSSVVVASTRHIRCDLMEACIDAGDIFDLNMETGLRVWEGRILYSSTPNSPNGPEEFDVDYVGKFRQLTDDEFDLIRSGITELKDVQ
jgi:hypothetical protein